LNLAIAGLDSIVKLLVPESVFEGSAVMAIAECDAKYRTFNGSVYWEMV